ncbi:MAG: hypothetical protein IPN81_12835 [Nitrosomonadales bacterium]|nr:hypothetical protein [Nitrosomonadales bacterium]
MAHLCDIRDGEVVPDYAASTTQMGRSGEVMIQGHVLALEERAENR